MVERIELYALQRNGRVQEERGNGMIVIVKGMNMPKNCAECRMWCICDCLNDFEDYESICYAVEDGDLVRDKNCPLSEISLGEEQMEIVNKMLKERG